MDSTDFHKTVTNIIVSKAQMIVPLNDFQKNNKADGRRHFSNHKCWKLIKYPKLLANREFHIQTNVRKYYIFLTELR